MKAPVAKRIPHPHHLHGDERQDDYYWLRNRDNPEVIAYLEAENAYYEEQMRPLKALVESLFNEMAARIPDVDQQVPVQDGPYFYYTRIEKRKQYPIFARKQAATRADLDAAAEQILLDVNELAEEGGYLSVTEVRVSPDGQRLAYLVNRDGTDKYTLCVRDLTTGHDLLETIPNVFLSNSVEWDQSGRYLFYITVDETQRPYRLWRHEVESQGEDDLLYEETDTTYTLELNKSRSGQYLFLLAGSKTTSEVRWLRADMPHAEWTLFQPRTQGVEYSLEHWQDEFLILTNEGAPNFRVLTCPVTASTHRRELFPYDERRYLTGLHPFREALFISGREEGLTQLWVYRDGQLQRLSWDDPLYTVRMGGNQSYDATEVLVQYESLLTPRTTLAVSPITLERTVLQQAEVPGEFDRDAYTEERLWAKAEDGTAVPLAVVYRRDSRSRGPAPLILNGYGSYGINTNPHFQSTLLPLLDRGVILAYAQVRGGSEMGRQWYEDGKLLKKRNTFTDFIACAQHLITEGYTAPDRLAAYGGSAGGLLMGAVANLGGELFAALAALVPFVDVVTTMLDESIPLTTLEWDEWGNPAEEPYYSYMKSYSPYDNVTAKPYPHLYVTAGLNDPRVAYWEPAKWVARLRATKTDDGVLVLKTHMGAGHFGSSGRLNRLRETAEMFAFLLDKIGAASLELSDNAQERPV
ncbi:S9 family peptidase [Alicyclobacillus herbarius]|uniref:S9 family peptidase n=1 Tax=Alicyclobacillus herbarius TaxID=122960 RepID=UPI00040954E3|nr:S9 family peptidase [Alicyclobacillus herbarius]